MSDSDFYYTVARNLFFVARNKTLSGPVYYLNFIGKVTRLAVNHPAIFIKRSTEAIIKRPKSLVDVFARRYLMQDWEPQSVRLKRANREYYEWIEKVEMPALDLERQRTEAKKFKKQPLISLITPVFDPPLKVHSQLIESVLSQTYDRFELLLYNFGTNQEVKKLLDDYAEKDARVKVKHGLPNKGISNNSNLCLKDAKGEFIGLLDHDDELAPNALFECIKAVNKQGADLIYTDKDMITEEDRRFDPTFKPDWSPEMELCGNYLTHFNIMRTELVRGIGGWDPATDGAQDWDLFWRIMEKTDKIAHVPKIVYHWRTVEGSTSNNISAKPYVLEGQIHAISKHLRHTGWAAKPYHDWTGQLYIDWDIKPVKNLFIIHCIYKGLGATHIRELRKLIQIISNQKDFDNSPIMIFGLQKEAEAKDLKKLESIPNVSVIEYKPGGFIEALVKGGTQSAENIFYITDSTKKISKDTGETSWLSQLNGWLSVPEIGMAGGLSHAPDGRVVDCGSFFEKESQRFYKFYFGTGHRSGYIGHLQWTRNFILPSERVFAFKADILKRLATTGSLDVSQFRDDELPKLLAVENFALGRRAVYDPSVTSVDRAPFHIVLPASDGLKKFLAGRGKSLLKNGGPYYNSNLSFCFGDPKPAMTTASKQWYQHNYELAAADFVLIS